MNIKSRWPPYSRMTQNPPPFWKASRVFLFAGHVTGDVPVGLAGIMKSVLITELYFLISINVSGALRKMFLHIRIESNDLLIHLPCLPGILKI